MCGISAIIPITSFPQITGENTDIIRHRGPDDEGHLFITDEGILSYGGPDTPNSVFETEFEKKVSKGNFPKSYQLYLGHRRLSIIDLSPHGHQPMSYGGGRYWIVFNGEIYNYLEIKEELLEKGYQFFSHSDTEVILASYAEWGRECFHKFIGMWALVIYDAHNQTLIGSRDRFGIKPLYYWFSPKGFLTIGSEIKQFTVLPGWRPVLNSQCAYDFLIHGIIDHTHETLFQNVFQLRGGENFYLDIKKIDHSLPIEKWYTIKPDPHISQTEKCHIQYLTKLKDSINIHLRSDVPVGSCLSGGLDSSAIVSLIYQNKQANAHNKKQQTFSACSEQKQWDESEYIHEVLEDKKITAHYVIPNAKGLFNSLKELLWYQDEPFASTSIYAQWLVFQSARENNIKVLLDGQGADEFIGGYHYFHDINVANLILKGKFRALLTEIVAIHEKHSRGYLEILRSSLYYILCNSKFGKFFLINFEKENLTPEWLNYKKLMAEVSLPLLLQDPEYDMSLFNRYCIHQTFFASLPALLHYEDRNSMAHSLESRVPYLDNRLVEFIINLDEKCKIHRGITKYIMRKALNSILPDKVRCRMDKMGFVTPEEYWIKIENQDLFKEYLEMAIKNSKGIIKPEAIKYFNNMASEKIPFSNTVWRMISFGFWMDLYKVTIDSDNYN